MAIQYSIIRKKEKLKFSGSLLELVGEVTYLVHKVHCSLRKQNPELAQAFMEMIMKSVGSEDSPVWK